MTPKANISSSSVIDELNSMAEKLKSNYRGVKKPTNFI